MITSRRQTDFLILYLGLQERSFVVKSIVIFIQKNSYNESTGFARVGVILDIAAGIPLLVRRGGCACNKMSRSPLSGADGVVAHKQRFGVSDHPVRSS